MPGSRNGWKDWMEGLREERMDSKMGKWMKSWKDVSIKGEKDWWIAISHLFCQLFSRWDVFVFITDPRNLKNMIHFTIILCQHLMSHASFVLKPRYETIIHTWQGCPPDWHYNAVNSTSCFPEVVIDHVTTGKGQTESCNFIVSQGKIPHVKIGHVSRHGV